MLKPLNDSDLAKAMFDSWDQMLVSEFDRAFPGVREDEANRTQARGRRIDSGESGIPAPGGRESGRGGVRFNLSRHAKSRENQIFCSCRFDPWQTIEVENIDRPIHEVCGKEIRFLVRKVSYDVYRCS